MIVRLNGVEVSAPKLGSVPVVEDSWHKLREAYGDLADSVIGWQIETLAKPIGIFFRDAFLYVVKALNTNSTEIITLGIMLCCLGMMVAPLLNNKGGSGGAWLGRGVVIGFIGAVWRMVI